MILKRQIFLVIFIFLLNLGYADCFARNAKNPFQSIWENDLGKVNISHCNKVECKIEIQTAYAVYSCELSGYLTVLSSHEAILKLKKSDSDETNDKRIFPIRLSRSKQTLTITIPEESQEAASSYCDYRAYFAGEYTNSNDQRVYKAGFDCNKAKTKTELAICHSPDLAYADNVLSELYNQLKSKCVDNIVTQQKEWIQDRDICIRSLNLKQCISDKYRKRILTLQQLSLISCSKDIKMNTDIPYNYDYLFFLSKSSNYFAVDIYADPPLQNYLNSVLPENITKNVLPDAFFEVRLVHADASVIMLQGGMPGLYGIYDGALVLTKDHQTWLAYINKDDEDKLQITILCPKNVVAKKLPDLLAKWVNSHLPDMGNKTIIYEKMGNPPEK